MNARESSLPGNIVNGDFEYPGWESLSSGVSNGTWTSVDPNNGTHYFLRAAYDDGWVAIPGFDKTRFGWSSTQTDGASFIPTQPNERRGGAVELQVDDGTGNVYAEITAAEPGTAIYQDIATIPGAVYTWSLRHASNTSAHVDSMQVMIGAPGHETAQEAERVTVNGLGDKTGPVGTIIATPSSRAPEEGLHLHEGQWETYRGSYTVPDGQTVTRFTFKAVSSTNETTGNLVDDISFEVSYPLTYDLNGGAGVIPNKQ